jgi:hypothetical protein
MANRTVRSAIPKLRLRLPLSMLVDEGARKLSQTPGGGGRRSRRAGKPLKALPGKPQPQSVAGSFVK